MVRLFLLVKVRGRSGSALRIQKATKSKVGEFCVLHKRKEFERLIGLDFDITSACNGRGFGVRGCESGGMENNSNVNSWRKSMELMA
jgi:hypothetical protein